MNYQKGLKSLRNGGDLSPHTTDQSRGMARHRRLVKMALEKKADLDSTVQSRERLREWGQKWDAAEETTGRREQARLHREQEKKPDIDLATARHDDVVKIVGPRIEITLDTSIDPDQPSFKIWCDDVLLGYRDSYDGAYDYAERERKRIEKKSELPKGELSEIDCGNGVTIRQRQSILRKREIIYDVLVGGKTTIDYGLKTLDEARAAAINNVKWKQRERLRTQRANGKEPR